MRPPRSHSSTPPQSAVFVRTRDPPARHGGNRIQKPSSSASYFLRAYSNYYFPEKECDSTFAELFSPLFLHVEPPRVERSSS